MENTFRDYKWLIKFFYKCRKKCVEIEYKTENEEATSVKAAEARGITAAAVGWLGISHRIPPKFLTQKRQRRELLSVFSFAHRPWQGQLDW